MGDLSSAVIGASAVLVVGYVNNILKEDYVRFLDGKALASALAGELNGHRSAFPRIETNLGTLILAKQIGGDVTLRSFASPTSPVFDASVGKLGLLGSPLAGDVAYVYEQIRAFRIGYTLVTEQGAQMPNEELLIRLELLQEMVVNGRPLAEAAVNKLNEYAEQRFLPWLGRRLSLDQFTDRVSGRSAAIATINPTQGDDPSGNAR
ncbi:TPA: hypothetical protein QDB15_005097 [Burkholderia vietnamiensis]|uniref:Uncharacterized protein n=1 Tax=Burkholderia vietnamiensis TaxID=60552 RepID=A0AA44XWZ4_BURVI|nr:hypothetical protein [Burkholderia vietnamiensis]KVS04090.1 hypothetical protein WK32_15620 [Burkholderia vietnamiensis]MCA8206216.1 hypothetical protein [Burkholderia vietnamiensis]PRH40133.1 hypothetical protein C6T65_22530 [Burkholderia vietnamiensis]HDR9099035.1 hypothetical protein [Burkholderia vietnamiensis]HDR9121253.1 hypothetical protein [Burkholderia vietnamiensis]